jgi:predicted acetyltransferase
MGRQLADMRDRGEAVAALWASEGSIYRRFGYGHAARSAAVTLSVAGGGRLRTDRPRDPALRLRLADPHASRSTLEQVFQAWGAGRNGEFARDSRLWDHLLDDPDDKRDGFGPLKCALADDEAGPAGYVLYRARPDSTEFGLPDGTVLVHEIVARTPACHASLWEHVIERDLVTTVRTAMEPCDSALFGLLDNPYQARTILQDNLWVRLVDLPAALEQRSYATEVTLVLEVSDRWCAWNAGRWRLVVDKGGVRCTPTDAEPDLRAEVTALGSAYLGLPLGRSLAAGDLTELREGAAEELAAALAQTAEPHCSVVF